MIPPPDQFFAALVGSVLITLLCFLLVEAL